MEKIVHLVHHTHNDYGYTDIAPVTTALLADYVGQAVELAWATRDAADDERFRYVFEAFEPVECFWLRAAAPLRRRFCELIERGSLEVTALPVNLTPVMGRGEWSLYLEKLRRYARSFRIRCAMQNDVNGFPCGILEDLADLGVEYIWMGSNDAHTPGRLGGEPGFFWNTPRSGRKLLVWNQFMYGSGFHWFHEKLWRRGPIEPLSDPWFYAPPPGEIYAPDQIARHRQWFEKTLAEHPELPEGWRVLLLPVTNQHRWDSDPPHPQLVDFVRAWNADDYPVKLRISTASEALDAWKEEVASGLPVKSGDWPDWWLDGLASTPVELRNMRNASNRIADLSRSGAVVAEETLRTQLLAIEHTWGAFESIAAPASARARGMNLAKRLIACEADEYSRLDRAAWLRGRPDYHPFADCGIGVYNPGAGVRSGWVEVRDSAQHAPGGVLRDVESGEVVQPELELCPGFRRPAVFSDSDEVWGGALPRLVRFFCSSLAPGAFRRYRWEEAPGGVAVPVEWSPCGIGELEEALGVLAAPETVGEFGVPLCECITGEVPRRAIERRAIPEERRQRERAVATGCFRRRTAGLTGFRVEYRLAFCDFVEAKWNFFTGGDVELRLRFWFSGTRRPIHIMTGFGFPAAGFGGFAYYSQATRVRVPDDIIPGGCGEGIGVNNGVELDYADGRLVVASPDTPIAMFGGIHSRDGNKFHPGDRVEPQLWFSILNSFWNTNFAHAERDELECRFVFSRLAASPDEAAGELWSYPVRV